MVKKRNDLSQKSIDSIKEKLCKFSKKDLEEEVNDSNITQELYPCPWKIYAKRGVQNAKLNNCQFCLGYGTYRIREETYDCAGYREYLKRKKQ